jgi:hypothetical protein
MLPDLLQHVDERLGKIPEVLDLAIGRFDLGVHGIV